jgi:tetratricopeptide (TPR) repeat protein
VIDEVHQRFADQFQQDAYLMYTLAQARLAQGDEKVANEMAEAALAMNEGDVQAHYYVFMPLQRRHWVRWAEQELRKTIEIGPPTNVYVIASRSFLADMLHDRGDEQAAVEIIRSAVESMDANIKADRASDNRRLELSKFKARMHYYHACQLASPGEKAERVQHLLDAAEQDPTDADVLIALYRTADLEPALREKTMAWINAAATEFRRRIQQEPEEETFYNQLAWLIANTEGDFDEALHCSQKSLELRPNDPGLLDTLARCYFALGDLDNAVKHQAKAVSLNPHSGLMTRQLALFREALANKQQP